MDAPPLGGAVGRTMGAPMPPGFAYPAPAPPMGPPTPLEKPTAAFVLSLLAGAIIVLWGIAITGVAFALDRSGLGFAGSDAVTIGVIEAVSGLLIVLLAILIYLEPQHHVLLGALILVFSIVSLVGLGGLLFGFILGLIGGSLGIAHKPKPSVPTVVYVQPQRICPRCGRAIAHDVRFCPYCGNPVS